MTEKIPLSFREQMLLGAIQGFAMGAGVALISSLVVFIAAALNKLPPVTP